MSYQALPNSPYQYQCKISYSIVEWDGVGSLNDYELVTCMLHVLYVISYGGVNIGEGIEFVWLCRVGDGYGYDMVIEVKVG